MNRSMTKGSVKQRSAYWDNYKGLLIALVVFAHCLWEFQNTGLIIAIVQGIYFFHMPAFCFISGFFSKSTLSRKANSLVRLLIAYLLFSAVFLFMSFIAGKELKIVTPYYSAWYLLAIIVWRLITPFFSKYKLSLSLFLALSLLAGFWKEIDNTFAVARIISFYPFFIAGYFFSENDLQKLLSIKPIKRIPFGIGLIGTAGVTAFFVKKNLNITQNDLLFNAYKDSFSLKFVGRIGIFIVAALCIIGLLLIMPKKRIPVVTKAGNNTLAIYLLHRPITLILNRFVSGFSTKALLLYAVVFTIFSLVVLGDNFISGIINKVLGSLSDALIPKEQCNDKKKQFYERFWRC